MGSTSRNVREIIYSEFVGLPGIMQSFPEQPPMNGLQGDLSDLFFFL